MRRSALFIPGNVPGMILGASAYGADGVIFDLEDAVAPQDKDAARRLVANALTELHFPCDVLVRINDITTPYWEADIRAVVPGKPTALALPKVETLADLKRFDRLVTETERACGIPEGSVKFMALIETAVGVENAYDLAVNGPRLDGLLLGEVDLALDLGAINTPSGVEVLYARSKLVVAARAGGIHAYGSAYTDIDNLDGLADECRRIKEMGFDGRPVIYPSHIALVNEIFMPTEAEIAESREILRLLDQAAAQKKGAAIYKGQMVDVAHMKRANRIIKLAEAIDGRKSL